MYRLLLLILPTIVWSAYIRYYEPCSTPVCRQSARFIIESLDRQVSPCDDFYQFACGGWLQKHNHIPATKPLYSVAIQIQDQMIENIRSLLESNQTAEHSSRTIRLAKFLYDQCLSIDNEMVIDQSHLVESLFAIHDDYRHNDTWYNIYLSNLATIHAMFRIVVVANPRNTSEQILAMDTASFPLDDIVNVKTRNRPTMVAYQHYLEKISKLIPYLRHKNDSEIVELIDEMIDIEIRLASIKMTDLDHQDLSKIINIMSIADFERQMNFPWLDHIFRPTFRMFDASNVKISRKNLLLITDLGYFRNFTTLIETIPGDKLRTFLDFQLARMVTPYLGEQYRRYMFEFLKTKSGVKRTPNRWRTCYSQIEKILPWALSRLYVDHNHLDMNDRKQAGDLVDSIHETFIEMVNDVPDRQSSSNTWIDNNVRQLSLKKLNHIRKNVAFPQWLLDDHRLDRIHHLDDYVDDYRSLDDYIPTMIRFEWNQMQSNLLQLNNDNNDIEKDIDSWAMEPAMINAAYSPIENTISKYLSRPSLIRNFVFEINIDCFQRYRQPF